MEIYLIFVLLILSTIGLNTLAEKLFKQHWNLWLGYGIPTLGMILFLGKVSRPLRRSLFSDFFTGYYPASHLILQNPSALYNTELYKSPFGFVNIPIVALFLTPFSLFNRRLAAILFTLLGILVVIVACYLLIQLTRVTGWRRMAIIGLFAINGPLYHSLRYANLTHFVLLVLVAAFFCLKKRRDVWVGILIAIAALIKLPLLLLGIYFAFRRRWRVILGLCAALFVIVGASVLLFGFDLHIAWWFHIQQFSGKPISAYNVQSLDGFLARLLTNPKGELENWQPIEIGWDFRLIRYALLSLFIGTTFWCFWRSKPPSTLEEENLEVSIILCLALVISPLVWTHYYLFLLLPLSLYIGNYLSIPTERIWLNLVVASILLISLPTIIDEPANLILRFLYVRLLISHYFFGGILLLGVFLTARWHQAKRSRLPLDEEDLLLLSTD
jgi:hypothetical protein